MKKIGTGFVCAVVAAMTCLGGPAAAAVLEILVDTDNDPSTGCIVDTPEGPFAGVESLVATTVDHGVHPPTVTGITTRACIAGALEPATSLDPGGWPVGVGNGTAGVDVVETWFPDDSAYGQWRLGFVYRASDAPSASDGVVTVDGGAGAPIVAGRAPVVVIPTLAEWGLLALVLALCAAATWRLRRRPFVALTVAATVLGATAAVAMTLIVLDGEIADWTGVLPLAIDPSGDADGGADLAAVFVAVEPPRVYVRADVDIVTAPDPFAFTDQVGVPTTTWIESNVVGLTGLGSAVPISVVGGEYRIDGGGYTSAAGTIGPGQSLQVRVLSSSVGLVSVEAVVTVGGVGATFTVTTQDSPDPFAFTDLFDVPVRTQLESDAVVIGGLAGPVPISVVGGEYQVDLGGYTGDPGVVTNGQSVQVRMTSSESLATVKDTVLTVGGRSDTFSVTTEAACAATEPPFGTMVVVLDAWADYGPGDLVPTEVAGPTEVRILSTNNPFISNTATSYLAVTFDEATGEATVASNECFDYGPGFCLNVVGTGTVACSGRMDLDLEFVGYSVSRLVLEPQ